MSDAHDVRSRSNSADVAFRKIFIGGLSYSTDEEKLKKYFKQFGPVQDAVVMKDPVSKRSRGFGFITFYDSIAVDSVLANEPHTIDARRVEAKRAVPRSEMNRDPIPAPPSASKAPSGSPPTVSKASSTSPSHASGSSAVDARMAMDPNFNMDEYAYHKIFVGGLHYDTRDAEFRAYFEKYGKVLSAEVMFNRETHKSRGFGFIVFESEDGADRVCAVKEHIISGKVVEVKRAIPRSKIGLQTTLQPPSTPVKESSSSSLQTSLSESPTNSANIRSNVRRTMSTGSAQCLGSSPMTLSANSSTMAASASVQKPLSSAASTGALSASNSMNRKANSTVASCNPPVPPARGASYAAALLMGSGLHSFEENKSQNSLDMSDNLGSMSHSPIAEDSSFPSISSVHGVSLLNGTSSAGDVVRPARAHSEPIVKFEGSSALDGEPVPFDFSDFTSSHAGLGVIQPSSNNPSRSPSIVLPQGAYSNNISWLSGASTMSFETSVDNGINQKGGSDALFGTASSNSQVDFLNSTLQFGQNVQYRAASEQDDRSSSLFGSPSSHHSSFNAGRMRASSLGALGSAPTPEVWAAMLASQSELSSMNAPPTVASQSNLASRLFAVSSDDANASPWRLSENASLFGTTSSVPPFPQGVGVKDEGVSRVLSFTQTQQPNASKITPSKSLGDGSGQTVSSYSDLRLDSPEFQPLSSQKW